MSLSLHTPEEELCGLEREFMNAQQAAYMKLHIEDDEIAERLRSGAALMKMRGVT